MPRAGMLQAASSQSDQVNTAITAGADLLIVNIVETSSRMRLKAFVTPPRMPISRLFSSTVKWTTLW